MSSVIVRPQVKRVIVRTPGPQGPPGDVGDVSVTSVAGRTGDVTLTKGDVGLGNVDNTADASKPVSTLQAAADSAVANAAASDATSKASAAQAAAESTSASALSSHIGAADPHTGYQLESEKGQANGYASLDGSGKVPSAQLPPTGSIGGALGSTDNALTRADGTGGSTAQGSGVTLDDNAVLLAANWTVGSGTYSTRTYAKFCAVGSNIALVLGTTGTGFICAAAPDGASGGNLRGNYSVDLQLIRTVAAHIASGSGAALIAGNASVASGLESVVAAGRFNVASSDQAFVAGNGCTASGFQSSCPGGFGNVASGTRSMALGSGAQATLWAQIAHSGYTGTNSQRAELHAYRATTDATPSNLFLDGTSARLVVPANSSGCAMITVVARTATAGAETMTWRRRVNWQRGVAVGTVTVDVETVGTDRGYTGGAWGSGPAWSLSITADTTNGAVNIIGTGAAATNIRWGASIEWIETRLA